MTCLWCGEPLATRNRRARYCGAACRSNAHRHGPRAVPIGDRQPRGGQIVAIVSAQLEALGCRLEDDDLARAALALARALDDPRTPPSALVPLSKELPAVLAYLREREGSAE